jgi:hypothetical protein
MDLLAPFRYIAGTAKVARRKLSAVIKWYFTAKDLLPASACLEVADWSSLFKLALDDIKNGNNTEENKLPPARKKKAPFLSVPAEHGSPRPATAVDDYPDTIVVRSYDLPSTRRSRTSNALGRNDDTPDVEQGLNVPKTRRNTKLELYNYLKQQGEDHRLKDIPASDASSIQFCEHGSTGAPLSQKLYIGTTLGRNKNVYAHKNGLEVTYTTEGRHSKAIVPGDFARINLVHPFWHTCQKNAALEPADELRLHTIVLWYFITRGYDEPEVLPSHALEFAKRLSDTLRHIAHSMEAIKLEILKKEAGEIRMLRSADADKSHAQTSSTSRKPPNIASTITSSAPTYIPGRSESTTVRQPINPTSVSKLTKQLASAPISAAMTQPPNFAPASISKAPTLAPKSPVPTSVSTPTSEITATFASTPTSTATYASFFNSRSFFSNSKALATALATARFQPSTLEASNSTPATKFGGTKRTFDEAMWDDAEEEVGRFLRETSRLRGCVAVADAKLKELDAEKTNYSNAMMLEKQEEVKRLEEKTEAKIRKVEEEFEHAIINLQKNKDLQRQCLRKELEEKTTEAAEEREMERRHWIDEWGRQYRSVLTAKTDLQQEQKLLRDSKKHYLGKNLE